ncbi:MAG TPA: hypothetical protein VIO61_01735 [Anaerolineaceae bacterium]
MDIVLWVIQVILAVKCLTTALSHGLQPGKEVMRQSIARFGAGARSLHLAAAILLLCASLFLLLPAIVRPLGGLLPYVAGLTAVLMLVSIPLHVKSREDPKLFAGLILLALAVFTVYGRLVLAPF